jgi:hypothetical protein
LHSVWPQGLIQGEVPTHPAGKIIMPRTTKKSKTYKAFWLFFGHSRVAEPNGWALMKIWKLAVVYWSFFIPFIQHLIDEEYAKKDDRQPRK